MFEKTKIQDMKTRSETTIQEKQLSSKNVYSGVLLHVFQDTVQLPDGNQAVREYIRHFGAVCMVVLTDEGNVIMERQYRYANGRPLIEIPAGKLDYAGEDRLEAAKRELLEETGYTADHWQELGGLLCAPAYAQEYITMYLATSLHPGKQKLDPEEFLEVFEVPLSDLVDAIMRGEIEDAKTIAAILKTWELYRTGRIPTCNQ